MAGRLKCMKENGEKKGNLERVRHRISTKTAAPMPFVLFTQHEPNAGPERSKGTLLHANVLNENIC